MKLTKKEERKRKRKRKRKVSQHHERGPDDNDRSSCPPFAVNSTPSAHTFFSCSFCQRACPSLLSQLFRLQPHCHALTPRTCVAQGAHCLCLAPKKVIRYTSLEHCTCTGHVHSILIFDTIFLTPTFQPASTMCRSTTSSERPFG